jgi:GMP synthase (glutamine-hydrolysing)
MQPDSRFLIIKAGSYSARAQSITDRFGDQDDVFINTGEFPRELVEVVAIYEGQKLTRPPQDYHGVLITGSGAMLSAPEPWMVETASWLREAVTAGVPTLGVCFGHQMLAYALGSRIGPNPNGLEAGTIEVEFNEASRTDPLFSVLPEQALFNSHHYETVLTAPEGAEVLGCSAKDRHQALRYAEMAWGVQFHPEIDKPIMLALIDVIAEGLTKNGISVDDLVTQVSPTPVGSVLLKRFYKLAMGEEPACA